MCRSGEDRTSAHSPSSLCLLLFLTLLTSACKAGEHAAKAQAMWGVSQKQCPYSIYSSSCHHRLHDCEQPAVAAAAADHAAFLGLSKTSISTFERQRAL